MNAHQTTLVGVQFCKHFMLVSRVGALVEVVRTIQTNELYLEVDHLGELNTPQIKPGTIVMFLGFERIENVWGDFVHRYSFLHKEKIWWSKWMLVHPTRFFGDYVVEIKTENDLNR